MASETIVAVYDTPAHAELAIADLEAAGIPASAIQHYTSDRYGAAGTTYDPAREPTHDKKPEGLWAWLMGDDTTHAAGHHEVYDRSLQSGGTVVTVVTEQAHAGRVVSILEEHAPIDLQERATQYGATEAAPASVAAAAHEGTEDVIRLAEETLAVGKRAIDRGTTLVRRYVVERPVEEQIRLRDEKVSVFRRPVTDGTVGAGAFTDKTVRVTETAEEAVIEKSARVVDEVVVRKTVGERAETVRDTLRREEVEITGPHGDAVRTAAE